MRILPFLLSGTVLALLLIVLIFGADIIGGPAVIGMETPIPDEASSSRLALLLASVDQMVSMLTAIAVGLTIVVGFALKEFWTQRNMLSRGSLSAAFVFVGGLFAALFYAYAARQQAFEFIVFQHIDFLSIKNLFVMQAVAVAVEAAAAFYLLLAGYLPGHFGAANSAAKTASPKTRPRGPK